MLEGLRLATTYFIARQLCSVLGAVFGVCRTYRVIALRSLACFFVFVFVRVNVEVSWVGSTVSPLCLRAFISCSEATHIIGARKFMAHERVTLLRRVGRSRCDFGLVPWATPYLYVHTLEATCAGVPSFPPRIPC